MDAVSKVDRMSSWRPADFCGARRRVVLLVRELLAEMKGLRKVVGVVEGCEKVWAGEGEKGLRGRGGRLSPQKEGGGGLEKGLKRQSPEIKTVH